MKSCCAVLLSLGLVASASDSSPIGKVIEMISDMQAKIQHEGEESQHVYEEAAEWCEDKSKDIAYEISTGKSQVDDLSTKIEDEQARIASLSTKIEDLAASVSSNEADLKEATELRAHEAADHDAETHELSGTLGELTKALNVLAKMHEHGSAMLQMKNTRNLAQALQVMVDASALTTADADSLTALLQNSQQESDEEAADEATLGAPAVQGTEEHTGGIQELIEGLHDKAEARLEKAQQKERDALNHFKILKLSLEDEIKNGNREMSKAKKDVAHAKENLATAQGDLEVTKKDLAEDEKAKQTLHHDCMSKARDFEAETKSRGEELNAIATAKKIIIEATGGAASFLQIERVRLSSSADLANLEVAQFMKQLARKQPALTSLAQRIATVSRSRNSREDIFAKVRGLINDMIAKLEDEAAADASEKAYCDKELGESTAKHDDLATQNEDLSTRIDQATARSKKLKEQVADLQSHLSKMAKSEAQMDQIRLEEKTVFNEQQAETEKALNGVKKALQVLHEYYAKADTAHGAKSDSAGGIMDLLEVCESDFSKTLAEITSAEESAVADYDAQKKENEMERSTKEQDIKYKNKEAASLEKSIVELSSDRDGVSSELAAVNEYLGSIKEKCVAKPESYAERKQRREAEIAGLKNAMEILEGEAVLLQKVSRKRMVRSQN